MKYNQLDIITLIFLCIKSSKNSAFIRILIKTACTKKKNDQNDERLWQNCYKVTWSAEMRRVTRILRCNNCHYRSSRCSRMYWTRKLILRDAQFASGCDGSRISRDSAREKKDKNVHEERWKARWKAQAHKLHFIIFVILVVFETSMILHVCMYLHGNESFADFLNLWSHLRNHYVL